jgi:hypothetical protein
MTMNNKYGFIDSSIVQNLSFAVLLVDDFTGANVTTAITVSLKEPYREGILNNSGYYLFLDLDNSAKYTIVVELDLNLYAVSEKTIDLAILRQDPNFQKNPVVSINLLPNTSYPFPLQTTLVRGIIQATVPTSPGGGNEKQPVAGAQVKIVERNLTYLTDERGDYIFYFKDILAEDIVEEETQPGQGKKRFIKMGTSSVFTLIVDLAGYIEFKQTNNRAEEGKTTVLDALLAAQGKKG